MNYATFRTDQTKALFRKVNFEKLIDDVISNGDFNLFNVQGRNSQTRNESDQTDQAQTQSVDSYYKLL